MNQQQPTAFYTMMQVEPETKSDQRKAQSQQQQYPKQQAQPQKNKLEGNPNLETGFSCKWIKIEEAIKDTLGQSPNVERLSKYMNTGDWGEATLQ